MGRNANEARKVIKILSLGQCLNYGYDGVPISATYNNIAELMLKIRFPQITFLFDNKYLYHPMGLRALLAHRMRLSRPDVVMIGLPASYAARSWRVNRVYEIAPEVVDTARSFLQKISAKINNTTTLPRTTPLDNLFTKHAPLKLDEYENKIEDAVKYCLANSCRVILMGPGRFNEDSNENLEINSPALWSAVNRMVKQVGQRFNISVIDAQEALSEFGGEIFLPNNHRWNCYGHEIVAKEVEAILASEISTIYGTQQLTTT